MSVVESRIQFISTATDAEDPRSRILDPLAGVTVGTSLGLTVETAHSQNDVESARTRHGGVLCRATSDASHVRERSRVLAAPFHERLSGSIATHCTQFHRRPTPTTTAERSGAELRGPTDGEVGSAGREDDPASWTKSPDSCPTRHSVRG